MISTVKKLYQEKMWLMPFANCLFNIGIGWPLLHMRSYMLSHMRLLLVSCIVYAITYAVHDKDTVHCLRTGASRGATQAGIFLTIYDFDLTMFSKKRLIIVAQLLDA